MVTAILRKDRLASDGSREAKILGTFQGKFTAGFQKPLIPANADSPSSCLGIENLESRVTWSEIEFLLIALPSRNMGLPVKT